MSETAPTPAYLAWKTAQKRRRAMIALAQAGLLALFLIVWEIGPQRGWVNPMLTSYPTAVGQALLDMIRDGQLWSNLGVTLLEVVISFAAAMAGGTLIAVLLWMSPALERVLDPFLVVLNALPKIALVPIFYIWLGPTGSIYAVAIAVSIFITILMLYTGFRQTDPNKLKLVRTMGASQAQILGKVVLPGNLDTFTATLKANVGLSLVGVIVGEFQASTAGLGYLIVYGSQIFRMDMVMASIVVLGVISILIYLLIQWIERRLAR